MSFASFPWVRALRGAAPIGTALFVALLWLNQGITLEHYRVLEKRVLLAKSRSISDLIRFPFCFLYRRSGDEELYFASARAIRGLPRDDRVLGEARGQTPPEFHKLPAPDGHWHAPYREVAVEYPALVLPFILAPSFVARDLEPYTRAFGVLMGACLVLACWFAIGARRDLVRAERRRAWWFASLLMLAEGALAIQRLDAVVALALAVALWSASRGRMLVLGGAVGLAIAAKLVPILFVPPLLAILRGDFRSPSARRRAAIGIGAGIAIGFVPMLIMSAGSLGQVLRYHAERGLQVESTLATLVGVARLFHATVIPSSFAFGSYNLTGYPTAELAKLSAPMMALGAVLVTVVAARAPQTDDLSNRVALVLVSSLASAWMFGKVLSPQYFTWALPLMLLLAARSDRRIAVVYLAVVLVTQIYLRGYYDYVYDQRSIGVATLVLRQGLIAALGFLSLRALASPPLVRSTGDHNFTKMNDVVHLKGEC